MSATLHRASARVEGTVQGVGFRPYVYRLAGELGLTGYVLNDARGVLVEVQGPDSAVDEFLARLGPEAPPLAWVENVTVTPARPLESEHAFSIAASPRGARPDAPVPPDAATCADCLSELLDPGNRRHRYPFINCTNCGPRFTIVRGIPYDRPFTTMAGFRMCPACRAEYEDPRDRRFHAQPNACPECGPSLRLWAASGTPLPGVDPLGALAEALRAGAIAAVKGIGGFHLACRADHEGAVARLRSRKHREDKPFALMVGSPAQAEELVELGECERELLESPPRPIVLAPRRLGARVAGAVAPGARELGVMLPYTPLHHLLLADAGAPLVMTSGNVSDEPIAFEDQEAIERLGQIADLVLLNDRPIQTRTDDSVLRSVAVGTRRRPLFVRRSRGYVPEGLPLSQEAPRPLLACGAELKSTFCLARGDRAWVSHHIGDLQNYETLRSFAEGVEHFERLLELAPEVVVHDLHPDYLSTAYALAREGVETIAVQHHHAHLAACLAEHGERGPAVGAIFDGSGYGTDGAVWGGEILVGDCAGFRRVGSLRPVRLPGGERAIREPWRMACAWLGGPRAPEVPAALRGAVDEPRWRQVAHLAATGLGSPVTTSMGRLFDAVAALCGIRSTVNYEGQAAIELEAACDPAERGRYSVEVGAGLEIDPREAVARVLADIAAGVSVGAVAARFHAGVAEATVRACLRAASDAGTDRVVLSGGCFLNRRLLEAVAAGLLEAGLRPLVPERLPPGDGGISYGQAVVAVARMNGAA